jgi:hypothetical protein
MIRKENGTFDREFNDDPDLLVNAIITMLGHLPNHELRETARKKLIRYLNHPEANGGAGYAKDSQIHPKSGGFNASITGPICCRCGSPRRKHDIDGQRKDCEGFIEA